MRPGEKCHAEPSKLYPYLCWTGHGDLFSNCAFKLLPKVSNAPIPANNRPSAQILNAEATTKSPFRGCQSLKFQASLTFHKSHPMRLSKRDPHVPLSQKSRRSLPAFRWAGLPAVWQAGYGTLRKHASSRTFSLLPYTFHLKRRVPCRAVFSAV